jgi:hypothetical protein
MVVFNPFNAKPETCRVRKHDPSAEIPEWKEARNTRRKTVLSVDFTVTKRSNTPPHCIKAR